MQEYDASTASVRDIVIEFRNEGPGYQARAISFEVDLGTGDVLAKPHDWISPLKCIPAAQAKANIQGGQVLFRLKGGIEFQREWRGTNMVRPQALD